MGDGHEGDGVVGRRALLGGAAAVAGAAAGLSWADAAAADVASFPTQAPDLPAVLPPLVPGATVRLVTAGDFTSYLSTGGPSSPAAGLAVGQTPAAPPTRSANVIGIAGAVVAAPLEMPPGSRLVRMDVIGAGTLPNPWMLATVQRDSPTGGGTSVVGQVTSSGGAAYGFTVFEPELTLGVGERFTTWITTSQQFAIPPAEWFSPVAVLYQYKSSQPQLTLLESPVRVYDSRAGDPPAGVTKGKLTDGGTRTINALLGTGVAAGRAVAVLANLTAANTSGAGWLAAYKAGGGWPGTTNLNWFQANSVIANNCVVNLNNSGQCTVRAAGSADFFLDVVGYYL